MVSIIHVLIIKHQDKLGKEDPTSDPKTNVHTSFLKEEHVLPFLFTFVYLH